MKTLLVTIALCIVAAPSARADTRPALPGPPVGARAGQAPPLPWERIIRKCGKPCLIWARHILSLATSPKGFAWQIKLLAHAAREAFRKGQLRPAHALRLKRRLKHLALALRRTIADGKLTHRERLHLLRAIIKTGVMIHRAKMVGRHMPARPRQPPRVIAPPPAPPPAPGCPTASPASSPAWI